MKTVVLSIVSLFTVSLWSFANEDVIKFHANNESFIYSSNTKVNDSSKRDFSPEGIIMPRMGEYFQRTVNYRGANFPLHIFYDLEMEGYNLYAYIQGSDMTIDGYNHTMVHAITHYGERNSNRIDFIIICNYTFSTYTGSWYEHRKISFHVAFYPTTQSCSFEIIEDVEGRWEGEI